MTTPQSTDAQIQFSLGRIQALLEEQAKTSQRIETSLTDVKGELKAQETRHDERLRKLEAANPAGLKEAHEALEKRVRSLETDSARTGVWSGLISSVGMAFLVEVIRRWGK